MGKRIHKSLKVEELEARVAPVTLSGANPVYTFSDGGFGGDNIRIQYAGPGSADVVWKAGGATPTGQGASGVGDEILSISLHNTTAASQLILMDTDPGVGYDSLYAGTITGDPGKSFGVIQLITYGKVGYTDVNISQNLTALIAMGKQAKHLNLTVGGNLTQEIIQGALRESDTTVAGNVSLIHAGALFDANIKVGGNVSSIITTALGGKIDVGGNVNLLMVGTGGVNQSDIKVGGNALNVSVNGSFGLSTLAFGGKSNALVINGLLSHSTIIGTDINYFNGRGMWQSTVIGQNSIGSAYVIGNLSYSRIGTAGNAGVYYVMGDIKETVALPVALYAGQNLTQLIVTGSVEDARIEVGGSLVTSMILGTTTNMYFKVNQNLTHGVFTNTMDSGHVYVVGNATCMQFTQQVTQSVVFVHGTSSVLYASNGQKSSYFILQGGAGTVMLSGGMEGTHLNVNGDVNQVIINGPVASVSVVHVTGNTGMFMTMHGITGNSKVKLDGQVTTALLYGGVNTPSVHHLSTVTLGSLKSCLVATGGLSGTIDITNSAAGSTAQIVGELSGSLLAGTFGNVIVQGKFSGKIGDGGTLAGSGNMLVVALPGGGGTVQPANAFQNYIGYP